jgi:hypothetical protein
MRCPKCQFDHELQTTDCLKCGIVFSRYVAAPEAAAKNPAPAAPVANATAVSPSAPAAFRHDDAVKELKYRVLGLPLALLVARLVAGTSLRVAAGMLAMVLHESGHAITAWLTGRWAVPLLWVTMHGEERSWTIVLFLTAAIIFGGFLAWKMEHWGWVCAAGALLILQITILSAHHDGALVVFGGDGGAMVLATILMATFYAPRESALYQNWGLRWGLLVIGALTFMHVYRLWSGPFEDIPFGEIEGVNLSDPSLLTQMYGWNVAQLIDRYLLLAKVCFVFLFGLYVWGLISACLEVRSPGTLRWPVAANSR